MITLKTARRVPASASVRGELVASDRLRGTGLDRRQLEKLGFKGEADTVVKLPGEGAGVRVLAGVGPSTRVDAHSVRRAAAAFAGTVADQRSAVLDVGAVADVLPAGEAVGAAGLGVALGAYRDQRFKTRPTPGLGTVTIVGAGDRAEAAALREAQVIAGAVCFARDLVNEPGGSLTPAEFAARAAERAAAAGLAVTVLDRAGIEEQRLGGLLAVNKGSGEEPRLVRLEHRPVDAHGHVALVGKGITFDSGGLSIKPADGMMTMKCDMAGAAAVIAATCAAAELGLPVAITAITPLTDNMTGGDAQRPGDVFTARNGTTVEVLNTDAEGRLILADGLALATEEAPDLIVDLATLTGACMVALGDRIAGVMGTDDAVFEVESAAEAAGERVWHLPLPDDYRRLLDSNLADVKNIGSRYGGTLTAGLFLREFVGQGIPWAHVDIAGPAFSEEGDIEATKGATGFGVRTLVELLARRTLRGNGSGGVAAE